MKNVQIIDGAINCTFSIFQFSDHQFSLIFHLPGQDIAFSEEVADRLTEDEYETAFKGVWELPVEKSKIAGLHGTLFYGFEDKKNCFPTSRRECDWDKLSINPAQRQLYNSIRSKIKGK